MPLIRYTVKIGDDIFHEDELVRREKNLMLLVNQEIIEPMRRRREKLGDAPISLLRVEVINPFIHTHDWMFTYKDMSRLRSFYVCKHCEVHGYIPINTVTGEMNSHVTLDEKFKHEKWRVCQDVLRSGPKQLNFR